MVQSRGCFPLRMEQRGLGRAGCGERAWKVPALHTAPTGVCMQLFPGPLFPSPLREAGCETAGRAVHGLERTHSSVLCMA